EGDTQRAISHAAPCCNDAGNRERDRAGVLGRDRLKEPEVASTATADAEIARVNMLEEVQRDEIVMHLPEKVRQNNEDRESTAERKPAAGHQTPRRGEKKSRQQSGDEEHNRVLGHQANSAEETDPNPPPLVFAAEQANDTVRDEHPGELLKRCVLELCALEQRNWGERHRKRRQALCETAATERSRDQTGGDNDSNL